MPDEPDGPRLPPFPNDVVELRDKYRAIAFLNSLRLPPWIATKHLRRWGQVADVPLEAADYRAVEVFERAPPE